MLNRDTDIRPGCAQRGDELFGCLGTTARVGVAGIRVVDILRRHQIVDGGEVAGVACLLIEPADFGLVVGGGHGIAAFHEG